MGRGQWGALAAIGVIGGSVPFVLFFEGLSSATSPQAAFLHKTLVLWVAVLAVVFLGERLQWGHWLAIGAPDRRPDRASLGGLPDAFGTPEAMILGRDPDVVGRGGRGQAAAGVGLVVDGRGGADGARLGGADRLGRGAR